MILIVFLIDEGMKKGGKQMPSGSELEVLKIIAEKEETTPFYISRRMGSAWGADYIRMLCNSLGRNDYIDVLASGKLRITAKGKGVLKK